MKKVLPIITLFLIMLIFLPRSVVQADGIIVPPLPPPCKEKGCPVPFPRPMSQLEIRYHHVEVSIEDQLAKTHIDQVFYNPNEWPVEGTYVFPIPLEAVVTDFYLWIDGKPVEGKVLSADQARGYYEEIVRNLRDPALLEYIDQGALQASIFPIPPQGERRIELRYTQVLKAENGLVRYVYPLNTEKFSLQPLQNVSIKVDIVDRHPIRAVYSSSHSLAQERKSEHSIVVGYEEQNVLPDADFVLYYSIGEQEAFHLFTYRDPSDPSDPEGYFLLLLAPKMEKETARVSKDVLLVLDRSGSMDGEKFRQAQSALRYILNQLDADDRFYLLTFSTGIETYADGLRPASEIQDALAWVDKLSAAGSTDINRALLETAAITDRERPAYLIFLTDGLPTQGVIDTREILRNFSVVAPENLRLFAFGVGYDVDTVLLDSLSQRNHGQSTYVRPDENLDEVLSTFYERISTPVLTDLKLDFGTINVFDVYPDPPPDLFLGSQVIVVGRYREGGLTDMVLFGKVNGEKREIHFSRQRFTTDSREQSGTLEVLPRLWATRKIGYLLNKIRLDGPDKETIHQIVLLSIRYGIVTPYTSYLVTEPAPLGMMEQEQIVNDTFGQSLESPLEITGKSAVDRAEQEGKMQAAEVAPSAPSFGRQQGVSTEGGAAVRVVGSRVFLLSDGIWIDTRYDAVNMPTQNISFLSNDYFQLLNTSPELVSILALGDQLILVVGGQAIRIYREGDAITPSDVSSMLPTRSAEKTVEVAPIVPGPVVNAATPPLKQENSPQGSPWFPGGPCVSAALITLLAIWAVNKMKWHPSK